MTPIRPRSRRGAAPLILWLIVLVCGGVICFAVARKEAPQVQQHLDQAANRAVRGVDSGLRVRVTGRRVALEGTAVSVDHVMRAIKVLEDLPGVSKVEPIEPALLVRRREGERASDQPPPDAAYWEAWQQQAAVPDEPDFASGGGSGAKAGSGRRAGWRGSRATLQAPLALPTLRFPRDQVTLTGLAREQMDRLAPRLRARPDITLQIAVTGGQDGLDGQRARAIHAALLARGVSAGQLRLAGSDAAATGGASPARARLTLIRSLR